MKKRKILLLSFLLFGGIFTFYAFTISPTNDRSVHSAVELRKGEIISINGEMEFREDGCAFQTLMGNEPVLEEHVFKTPQNIVNAISEGLLFLIEDQNSDGGWAASKGNNSILTNGKNNDNSKKTISDPATTAMVSMAILRAGSDLKNGPYSIQLNRSLNYILEAIENTPSSRTNITDLSSTQIQRKLGSNIDCVLAAQFLGNIIDKTKLDPDLNWRVSKNLKACTDRIQNAQNADGSLSGSGWAGVLQSGFANSAIETANNKGIDIDKKKFERSKEYQRSNYDVESGNVKTDKGAGIVLYSVSGSVRATAGDAKKTLNSMEQAIADGKLESNEEVSPTALKKIGYTEDEASKLSTAYYINEAAKAKSQANNVITGYGNNGGEEFLSFLQTGESLIIGGDNNWKQWFDNTSGRILKIQNADGSWNGHHCITSSAFCTATCLLILSIENDFDELSDLSIDKEK